MAGFYGEAGAAGSAWGVYLFVGHFERSDEGQNAGNNLRSIFSRIKMKKILTYLLAPIFLSGCMAAVYAPVAGMANGVRNAEITTTIDNGSLTQVTKDVLTRAKRLGIVVGGDADGKVAELFESRGGYHVSLDRSNIPTEKLLPSERKEKLYKLCKDNQNDVALIGYITTSDHQNTAVGAVTGRAVVKQNWKIDTLTCRSKAESSLSGTIETDVGIYNTVSQDVSRKVGESLANVILTELGVKFSTSSSGSDSQSSATSTNMAANSASSTSSASSIKVKTLADAQSRLNDMGFNVGNPDGVMGRKTRDQLKAFQKSRGIQQTGKLDELTIAELNKI